MTEPQGRRPLASRNTAWAQSLARRFAATRLTPNQISMAGVGFAALAGLCLWGVGHSDGALRIILLSLAAAGCQLRLICNLLDGMVAIEAGKQTADGAFWNEFPDRVSDILIFVGLGLGVGVAALGWAAACIAVLTAYTRELGRAVGAAADYSGPMAKPQRMALVTAGALASVFDPLWAGQGVLLLGVLWVLCLGGAATVMRRARHLIAHLQNQPKQGT